MDAENLLLHSVSHLEQPIRVEEFYDAFMDFIGTSSEEDYDPNDLPDIDELFDLCVRYFDLQASHKKENDTLKNETIRLVAKVSNGKINLIA